MEFVTQRDVTVTSRLGRSFDFKANEPLHVPQMCWREVMDVGAVPVEELPTAAPAKVIPTGVERENAILAAMNAIALRNLSAEFTAGGSPHVAVLSSEVGFPVDAGERDELWQRHQRPEG